MSTAGFDQAIAGGTPTAGLRSNDAATNSWNNMNQTEHPVTAWIDRHAPQLGQKMEDRQGTVASQFPSVIEKGDPRDRAYALRRELVDARGEIPGVGKVVATQADMEYFRKKADDITEADFKAWFLAQMDLSTPEKQAYWQSKFGDVFAERKMLLEKQLDIHKQLAMIRMMGAQTKEDYMLLWAIKRGYIKVPEGPIFEPSKLNQTQFHRGLFNVKKLFPQSGLASRVNEIGGGASLTTNANLQNRINFRDPLFSGPDDTLGGRRTYDYGTQLGF